MFVSRQLCGCSYETSHKVFNDNPEFEGYLDISILCPSCTESGGQYDRSPHWKYPKQGKLSAKTLAFLAKGAKEAAERKFAEQYGDKPMQFGKKRA